MEDFIALVPDRRAADLLGRAIAGRGAFPRFKDTLFEFPELRERWFRFRDTRLRRRAIEFLLDVVLYGSQARGDAHPDSDVDIAVILDQVTSPWEEPRRME